MLLVACATSHERAAPSPSAVSRHPVAIEVGTFATLVTLSDGAVYSWGDQSWIPLSSSPRVVPELAGARSLAVGAVDFCGIRSGEAICLRNRPSEAGLHPQVLSGPVSLQEASGRVHARAAGDSYWELQRGSYVPGSSGPYDEWLRIPVSSADVVGAMGGLVVLRQGAVVFITGDGVRPYVQQPYDSFRGAVSVTHSATDGCVLLADATVRCWTGFVPARDGPFLSADGVRVEAADAMRDPGLTEVVEVRHSVFFDNSTDENPLYCARRTRGDVWCWGSNGCGVAELVEWRSDAVPTTCANHVSASPVRVDLPRPAVQLGSGARHACALLDDASIYCWGGNYHGQLGDGSRVDSALPVRVAVPPS